MQVLPGIQRQTQLQEPQLWSLSTSCSAPAGGTEPSSTLLPPKVGTPIVPLSVAWKAGEKMTKTVSYAGAEELPAASHIADEYKRV